MDWDLRLINERNSALHSQKYTSNIASNFFLPPNFKNENFKNKRLL